MPVAHIKFENKPVIHRDGIIEYNTSLFIRELNGNLVYLINENPFEYKDYLFIVQFDNNIIYLTKNSPSQNVAFLKSPIKYVYSIDDKHDINPMFMEYISDINWYCINIVLENRSNVHIIACSPHDSIRLSVYHKINKFEELTSEII